MAEKEIEGSNEGIFAKLKLGCPFQLGDEVKCTFTRVCRIQEEKAGVSSLFMEIQLYSLLLREKLWRNSLLFLLASPTGHTATAR